MNKNELVTKASRLIYKGLHRRNLTFKDKAYQELLMLYESLAEFRDLVACIAAGLELEVIDVTDKGIILSPKSHDSLFAMGLTEYRNSLGADTQNANAMGQRALIALIQVAIAAAFFPTAEALDSTDNSLSATLQNIHQVLIEMCQHISQTNTDHESVDKLLRTGREFFLSLAETDDNPRANLNTRKGYIKTIANHLKEQRLLTFEETPTGGFYRATHTYQKLLQRYAAGSLFELCLKLAKEA